MGQSKQEHIYFFWSASIVICMLLAFFALLFVSCSKSAANTPEEKTDPALESIQPYDPNATPDVGAIGVFDTPSTSSGTELAQTADMGQDYLDSITFLGDSTTYGLSYYKKVPATQVWTPASGTLSLFMWSVATVVYDSGTDAESEITIAEAAAKKLPPYMVITLGVNGVSTMDEASFKEEYTKLVQAVQAASPNTKIILNSIYPVTAEYPESTGITNAKIDIANTWIQSIAESTGCKYLNTASILKDESGALPADYDNGDNIHLNGDTFDLVINYIRTHGYL